MIIRIQASGGSFLGAGKYYLHDKLSDELAAAAGSGERVAMRGQSDDRVWFTDTRNCLSLDPERALEEMWRTADDQAYLKLQAGVKRGGRVCTDPVKTISLSWHKDDQPEPQHMIEQADSFLQHMGWEKHQAVYVGHNDTGHRHIHIVLNRVNPENGRTLDDYQEKKRAQVWALAYEKVQENVRCEERERRAAMREQREPEFNPSTRSDPIHEQRRARSPANDHLPHNVIQLTRENERAFAADERARAEHYALVREQLKAQQRAEREAFFEEGKALFKATRHAVYDEVRKEYAPQWKKFYQEGEKAWKQAEATSKSAIGRALHFAKQGQLDAARDAFDDRMSVRAAVAKEISDRKADLKALQTLDQRERQRDACDELRAARDADYKELLQRQRDERAAMMVAHAIAGLENGAGPKAEVETPSNQNLRNEGGNDQTATRSQAETAGPSISGSLERLAHLPAAASQSIREAVASQDGASINLSHIVPTKPVGDAPIRGAADLAAGGIGEAASYLADQLGELFAPTPPEVREAQAAARAQTEANRSDETPSKDDKAAAYARLIDSAVRSIETERAARGEETYWKDRDRGKGWERDQ